MKDHPTATEKDILKKEPIKRIEDATPEQIAALAPGWARFVRECRKLAQQVREREAAGAQTDAAED